MIPGTSFQFHPRRPYHNTASCTPLYINISRKLYAVLAGTAVRTQTAQLYTPPSRRIGPISGAGLATARHGYAPTASDGHAIGTVQPVLCA